MIIIAGLTLLGLILRIAFLLAMQAKWPGWGSPTIDALYHHLWALKIAEGDIIGGGPYFRAPLYPLFLGLLYAIFGANFTLVTLIQQLIGLCAIPLVFIAAKRYFNLPVAYIAAAITSINGVLIYFESQLLLDFLTVVFLLLFILMMDTAYTGKKLRGYLYSGLIVGVIAITRPNILALLPLFIIWILLLNEDIKLRIRKSLVLLIGTLILVLPVTIRNISVGHDAVLIASQGGVNFYIGNNEKADGYTALLPGFGHTWQYSDAEYEASEALAINHSKIKASEVSSYYTGKAISFITEHPADFLRLLVKKFYMFWNYFEISNNNNLYFLTGYIGMSFLPLYLFAIISPLGLVGTVLCFFKGRRYWIFPIVILGYMVTVIAFFVTGRFRLPLIPVLTIMAAFTISEIYKSLANRNYKRGIILIAATLLLGIFTWSNFYDHHDKSLGMAHYSLGNMLMRKGNYEAAKAEYQTALADGHCVPNASLNLGVIAFYENDMTEASRRFGEELSLCGPNARAYNNLAMIARLDKDYTQSIAWADSAIDHFPNFAEAYINKVLASFAANNPGSTEAAVKEFIFEFSDNPAAKYYYAMYKYNMGDITTAMQYYEDVIKGGEKDIVAEYDLSEIYSSALPYGYSRERIIGKSYYQLGLIAAQRYDFNQALNYFKQAVAYIPDDPDALINLALACDQTGDFDGALVNFEKAIALNSTNAVYHFNYAMTLGKIGDYTKAKTMLEKAVELDPDFTQARDVLEALQGRLR